MVGSELLLLEVEWLAERHCMLMVLAKEPLMMMIGGKGWMLPLGRVRVGKKSAARAACSVRLV